MWFTRNSFGGWFTFIYFLFENWVNTISEGLQLPPEAGFGLSPKQGQSQQKWVYLDIVWGYWGVRDGRRRSLAGQNVSPPELKSHQNKDSASPPVCTCLLCFPLPVLVLGACWLSLLTSAWQNMAVTVRYISTRLENSPPPA